MKKAFKVLVVMFIILPVVHAENLPQSEISIDFSKLEKNVNPMIFGHNVLGYDSCLYSQSSENCVNTGKHTNFATGLWNPSERKPDNELLSIAKRINTSVLRFPGGCGTHHYNWKETIGPLKDRPMFQFGIDEFITLCKAAGAELLITLSYFTGTDQDLADFIEYLNHPPGTGNPNGGEDWASVRAKNGHPDPYQVNLFELGNEVAHGNHTTIGNVDPNVYAERYLACRKKLRQIDQKLQLGAVLDGSSWDGVVGQKLKDAMDFGIVHLYPVNYRSDDGILSAEELFKIALAAPAQVKAQLEDLSFRLREYAGKDIPLAITEYNGGFVQNSPLPYRHCLGNALLIAELLRVFMTTDAPMLCANYWHFANSYWGLVYNPDYMKGKGRYYRRPNYFVFEMYAKHFGSQLTELSVSCPGYTSPAFGNLRATSDRVEQSPADEAKAVSYPLPPEIWHIRHCSGVKVTKTPKEIRLDFTSNEDINYYHTKVTRAVEPTHKYRLTGKIKAENLTSASGACLEIQDSRGWKKTKWAKSTHKVAGTTDWNTFMMEFQPRDNEARSLEILIRRISGRGKLTGTVRVKEVVFEDLGPAKQFPPTPYLSAVASTNHEKNKLYLMVINKHLTQSVSARIRVKDFPMSREGNYWILNGPSIDATNEGKKENVKISNGNFGIGTGADNFGFSFEPHSLTAIEIEKRGPK